MRFTVIFILFFTFYTFPGFSQDAVELTLAETLALAHSQSLDAFRAKNLYLASYWEYRSYQAGLLPHANLELRPFTFNRTMTQRYDINQNIEVFREQQTLNSYANLSVTQKIGLTGGTVFVDSDLNRLVNFGTEKIKTFSITPVRIGIIQPLFAYNETKWLHLLAPVKFEKAKQEFIREQQDINIRAVDLYFELVLASIKKEVAENNLESAEDLYAIGEKRFTIASIDREDLLNLELAKYNAEIALVQADRELQRAKFNLNSFLGREEETDIVPVVPDVPKGLQIDVYEAVNYAFEHNPEVLAWRQMQVEAEMNLERTVHENRLGVDLMASYGLNQQAEEFNNLYSNLLDQELVAITMNIPLLDWGERKGRKKMALRRKEVAEIEIKQARINFEQEVALKVIDFNIQEKLVYSASRADTISMESYALTEKRFRMGQADVLKLTTAMQARQQARENYIFSLYTYWKNYYEIQQLTLYDFVNGRTLEENFDEVY